MRTGIAIFNTDPEYDEPEPIIEAILRRVPLDFLMFEVPPLDTKPHPNFPLIAEHLGIEKIGVITLDTSEVVIPFPSLGIREQGIKRVCIRTPRELQISSAIIDFIEDLLQYEIRVCVLFPIGNLAKDKGIVQSIYRTFEGKVEYSPSLFYGSRMTYEIIHSVYVMNKSRNCLGLVHNLSDEMDGFIQWVKTVVVPAGVTEVCYPALKFARQAFFSKEENMVSKSNTPKKATSRKIVAVAKKMIGTTNVPLAMRSTTSLNSTIIDILPEGTKVEFVRKIEISENLVFGQAKEGYYLVLFANKVDYVTFEE